MRTHLTILLTTLALFCGNISLAQEVNSETKDGTTNDGGETVTAGQAEFEALSKQLTNSVFEGQFTIDGQDSPPKKEQYFLKKVKKLPTGDYWLFQTRILKYRQACVVASNSKREAEDRTCSQTIFPNQVKDPKN